MNFNKTTLLATLIVFSFSFLMFSCEDGPSHRNSIKAKNTKIEISSPKSGAKFVFGDTIPFKINLKKIGEKVAVKTSLFINGKMIADRDGDSLSYNYASVTGTGGDVKIKAVMKFEDGKVARKRMEIKIVSPVKPIKMTYQLANLYPHDIKAYTQGLKYEDGIFYEGTGNYGQSELRKVEVKSGKIIEEKPLESKYFGEGITLLNDTIFQITYKSKVGFYYDKDFNKLGEFNYDTEGWGLDNNGEYLLMSDGSAYIYFIDTHTFQKVKSIQVFNNKGPVYRINELEYVDGFIYANVYTTDEILKIDAKNGMVLQSINVSGILKPEYVNGQIDYLNGIAYNPANQSFFITGKWWPKMFEVRFVKDE